MNINKTNPSFKITIIIFGKNGQVARDLIKIFANKPNFQIYNYSSQDIDFKQPDKLNYKLRTLPYADFIINATAYNEVDKAEDEKEIANLINHESVKEIANYCYTEQIRFIHYSTNYVFDGRGSKPYKEDNTTNLHPISAYGMSKLAGEKAIIDSNCSYLILRLSTVFNLETDNNFVAKINKLAASHNELKIVSDQITNPTNSLDIAQSTVSIIEQINKQSEFKSGIYHLASQNAMSYYEFSRKIIKNLGFEIPIIPVSTDHFPTKAKRPLNGSLDVDKVWKQFGIKFDVRLEK